MRPVSDQEERQRDANEGFVKCVGLNEVSVKEVVTAKREKQLLIFCARQSFNGLRPVEL